MTTKGNSQLRVWPSAAGVIVNIKEAPLPAGGEDVSYGKKKGTFSTAQTTSIARLMTTKINFSPPLASPPGVVLTLRLANP
jgi:hypothetical protein